MLKRVIKANGRNDCKMGEHLGYSWSTAMNEDQMVIIIPEPGEIGLKIHTTGSVHCHSNKSLPLPCYYYFFM